MRLNLICVFIWAVWLSANGPFSSAAHEPRPVAPKIPLGHETSRVEGPLDAEGYVDYAALLRARYGKGVTPENNACALLWAAVGTAHTPRGATDAHFAGLGIRRPPGDGDYLVPYETFLKSLRRGEAEYEQLSSLRYSLSLRPWRAAEHPRVARWLQRNNKPLGVAIEAVLRPKFYSPATAGNDVGNLFLPEFASCHHVANTLRVRAMLHTGEGRYAEAWNDLQICFRLARHLGGAPSQYAHLSGTGIEVGAAATTASFAGHVKASEDELRAMLATLDGLAPLPSLERFVDETMRYSYLDIVQHLAGGDGRYLARQEMLHKGPVSEERLAEYAGMDFTPALREGNRRFDELVAACRRTDRAVRHSEIDRILHEIKAQSPSIAAKPIWSCFPFVPADLKTGREIGDRLLAVELNLTILCERENLDAAICQSALAKAALSLSLYRKVHGEYPPALDALATQLIAPVPIDPCCGEPFRYVRTVDGYRLYSVGLNGIDDGGRTHEDWLENSGIDHSEHEWDDIRIAVPPEPEPY
jgi:hypothetical protein